jgi:hypothetical protein
LLQSHEKELDAAERRMHWTNLAYFFKPIFENAFLNPRLPTEVNLWVEKSLTRSSRIQKISVGIQHPSLGLGNHRRNDVERTLDQSSFLVPFR